MERMRLYSFFLNRLYLFQSLSLERMPWFLPLRSLRFWFLVAHLYSCVDGSAYLGSIEKRETGYAILSQRIIIEQTG